MKLRWLLPPLAALCVGGALWVARHGRGVTAETLLADARAALSGTTRDPRLALRAMDEALALVDRVEQAELHRTLLTERSLLYRAQGLTELALADCRTLLGEHGPEAETLARAHELALWLGDAPLALEFARSLETLDPAAAKSRIGRCQVALADRPLRALEEHVRAVLPGPDAALALELAQRAAVFAGDAALHTAALDELHDLFPVSSDRRRVSEWVREASERLESARGAFVQSLEPGSSADAVAGLQDLFLRGGDQVDAAELGLLALTHPKLAQAMPVLARTASALVALGRDDLARALILDLRQRNPGALRPDVLPSNELRDELVEWCLLLEKLELWEELRRAAFELAVRGGLRQDRARGELALFLQGRAGLALRDPNGAGQALGAIGTNPLPQHDIPTRIWILRAELARRARIAAQERYALLMATRAAPLDPGPELAAELGPAWLRLSELRLEEGVLDQALECLTHALRLLPKRFAELEPRWIELGQKALTVRGKNPFGAYTRASNALERKQYGAALFDAGALLADYPGFGPALEVLGKAAFRNHDYNRAIKASLEVLARGWAPEGAIARLRAIPEAYFLPGDRLRWMRLAPRGSIVAFVERLGQRGDVEGAARAARLAQVQYQAPEDVARLARALLEAGASGPALETLQALSGEAAASAASAGLVLRAALQEAWRSEKRALLEPVLARLVASGPPRDPELLTAMDLLFAAGFLPEAGALARWFEDAPPAFLGEALLRVAVQAQLELGVDAPDDARERAIALLDDGRAELGRLIAASEQDEDALAREARALLGGTLGTTPARRAALHFLAQDPEAAARELGALQRDGRDALGELVQEALGTLAAAGTDATDGADLPALEATGDGPTPRLAPELLAVLSPAQSVLLALASDVPPWSAWTLARTDDPALAALAWPRLLRARSVAALGLPERARRELVASDAPPEARVAWTLVQLAEATGRPPEEVHELELAWLRAAGEHAPRQGRFAALQAELRLADGQREEARAALAAALLAGSGGSEERRLLARLEREDGRPLRAFELLSEDHATAERAQREALVPELLALLGAAREAGAISDARWWTEIEALEAEHPADPAPVRALAERAFEQAAREGGGGLRGAEMLARLRTRTLGRGLESLRRGEGLAWVRLLARYSPTRALTIAREELELAPLEPTLWRALAEAQIAAGRWPEALATLETIRACAPDREGLRLLAMTGFRLDSDVKAFQGRLALLQRLDEGARTDPLLSFYRVMADLRTPGKDLVATTAEGLRLWSELARLGLAEPRLGRAFALTLFESGRRDPALRVLAQAEPKAGSALELDLFRATTYLMKASPESPRVLTPLAKPNAAPATPGAKAPAGKAPAGKAPAGKAQPKPPGGARKKP